MAQEKLVKDIPARAEDFSQWYLQIVKKADLADNSDIRGCMVIKPYGYAIWEAMQQALDRRIKETGHQNAYFPLFVPESYLKKEAEHVEGFAPECAWVTIGGGKELEERLAIRPTSEAIICATYAKWIRSYRDLPLLINQWANVVRWEMRTRPFLRTCEFLWQEGHTCHRTHDDAHAETMQMLEVYRDFMEKEMAMPVITGRKSDAEKFAGASATYTCEGMMQDGLALQAGTSHDLGQHFAQSFGITFLDEDNSTKHVWQTSWGVSTRLVGGLIMTHSDDNGLIVPPNLAPLHAVIVPIYKDDTKKDVLEGAKRIAAGLKAKHIRVKLDDDDTQKPGSKYAHWELRGVPVRIEIGPRDLAAGQVVLVRRDTRAKTTVSLANLPDELRTLLNNIQADLYEAARQRLVARTHQPMPYADFSKRIESERGFFLAGWDGTAASENKVKDDTKATLRCIPNNLEKLGIPEPKLDGLTDMVSGAPAKSVVIYARNY